MIRVFHIITHFDVGGAERVAVNIAKSKNPDFEYHIVELMHANSKFTPAFIKELDESHIRYHRGFMPQIHFHYMFERLAAFTFPFWFIFLFLKYRPQVIHTHTEMPDLATYCFFKLFPRLLRKTKIVRTIHSTQLWYGMKKTGVRIEKWMQSQHANVAISSSVRDEYEKNYHESTPIINNGVAPMDQKPYSELVKGKTNILFAGRFEEYKGIDILIETVKAMSKYDEYFFHIAGSGRMEKYLKDELQGCTNCVIVPPIYSISTYLGSFDFLFMPSLFEGLGMLSIEASMSGLPVVANDCEGLRDTLPADWPLKSESNSVEDYVRMFTSTNRGQRRDLIISSKTFVGLNFSIEKMQQDYERKYLISCRK